MFTDWRKVQLPETPAADESAKPEPIRPKGASSRLPLLVLIALLALLFIGYRSVIDSQAWQAVETFFRQNQEVRAAVGEVRTCRPWYPLKVDFTDDVLLLQVTVRIKGTKGERLGYVLLKYERDSWEVAAAALEDGRGRARTLLERGKAQDTKPMPRPVPPAPASTPPVRS